MENTSIQKHMIKPDGKRFCQHIVYHMPMNALKERSLMSSSDICICVFSS